MEQTGFAKIQNLFASLVIPIAFVIALFVYFIIMGAPSNFQGNDSSNLPLQGNFLGLIYKGGYVVPILLTLLLTAMTF